MPDAFPVIEEVNQDIPDLSTGILNVRLGDKSGDKLACAHVAHELAINVRHIL